MARGMTHASSALSLRRGRHPQQLTIVPIHQQEQRAVGRLRDVTNPLAQVDALLVGHLVAVQDQPDQRLRRQRTSADRVINRWSETLSIRTAGFHVVRTAKSAADRIPMIM
jgi:hypothetical protein